MPTKRDARLGIWNVWQSMKAKGTRKAEMQAALPASFDLDAFIASQKKSKNSAAQMAELARLALLVQSLIHSDSHTPAKSNHPDLQRPRQIPNPLGLTQADYLEPTHPSAPSPSSVRAFGGIALRLQ